MRDQLERRHRLLPEKAESMAKAGTEVLRKTENWRDLGLAIQEVRYFFKLSLKEFAKELGDRDERQVAAWESADERPQIEVVFAVKRFRQPLVVAMARLASIEIVTQLNVRTA